MSVLVDDAECVCLNKWEESRYSGFRCFTEAKIATDVAIESVHKFFANFKCVVGILTYEHKFCIVDYTFIGLYINIYTETFIRRKQF